MAYRYLFFDLDGTVTDPMLGITRSVQYALQHFSIEEPDLQALTCYIGPPLVGAFMRYHHLSREQAEQALIWYRERFATTGLFENSVYPGMVQLLQALREQGMVLSIATSKPTVYAQQILDHFELSQYFEHICGSELDGTRSRKAEVIEHALLCNRVSDRSEVVMIGDREHDVIGAREAGVDCIGVLYGYGSLEELTQAGATRVAADLPELFRILTQQWPA